MISIHKLVLLIHLIKKSFNDSFQDKVTLDTVELAIQINDFYYTNFQLTLNYINNPEKNQDFLRKVIDSAKLNKAQAKDVANITGYSAGYISKIWNSKTYNK